MNFNQIFSRIARPFDPGSEYSDCEVFDPGSDLNTTILFGILDLLLFSDGPAGGLSTLHQSAASLPPQWQPVVSPAHPAAGTAL